ncbi:hypothetical protein GGG16DRAFT_109590 [Schizophyllum commune]
MKFSALILLFAATCALARPEPHQRPECAKPCWDQKEIKATCDPNQKACYCELGSKVPYQVGNCIIDKCTNELDRDRAIVDASETCLR